MGRGRSDNSRILILIWITSGWFVETNLSFPKIFSMAEPFIIWKRLNLRTDCILFSFRGYYVIMIKWSLNHVNWENFGDRIHGMLTLCSKVTPTFENSSKTLKYQQNLVLIMIIRAMFSPYTVVHSCHSFSTRNQIDVVLTKV